jgi:putative PIN family toxin of toxin-antitoxin system
LRCVFDTNVLVSALLLPDSKPRQALELALRGGKLLLSFAVLAELYEVLGCKRFRRYVDEEDIRGFLAALTREAEWVEVDVRIAACRDPKDDKFLELAVSGHGTHVVAGDSDLLALNPFQGIEILPPHLFLQLPPAKLEP